MLGRWLRISHHKFLKFQIGDRILAHFFYGRNTTHFYIFYVDNADGVKTSAPDENVEPPTF